MSDVVASIIDMWDERVLLPTWGKQRATARQMFRRTDIILTKLNNGRWRWVVRDFADATIGFGTEDNKKLARAAAKERKAEHQATLRRPV